MIFYDWLATEIISGLTPLAWYQYQLGGSGNHVIYDSVGDKHLVGNESDAPVLTSNILNGYPAWYFDGTPEPLVYSGDVTIRHAFVLASNEDATFATYQGLLTGETTGDVLVGDNGTTKFFDLGIDNIYTKEGTSFAENNQQAPMSGTFRLLEVKNVTGIDLDGIQVGQQRALTARKWQGHFVEMVLFDRVLTRDEIRRVRLYFNVKFGEWQRGLPLYFPSADITPTVGPSRFYDVPKDYGKITDDWEYEDGTKDFNEIADDAPMRWEYAYPAVPKAHLPIYNEFWNQARLVNSFSFKDPEDYVWDNVRIEDYNRSHQAHMRWRHDVAFRLVGFNSTGTYEGAEATPDPPDAPTLTATAEDGDSILLEWSVPDTEEPTAPVLSSAVADDDTKITMIWAASSDNIGVTGYETRIDGGAWTDRGLVLTYQYTGLTASTAYDFEVRAYDAAGNFSDPSNLITETTDAATPFSPDDISGLMLWLEADALALSDGDPVGSWPDSSAANNDFAQATALSKPTYQTNELNSLPVVRFDGSNDSLVSASITGLSAYTFFIVAKDASASNMWVLEMGNTNNSIISNFSNAGQYGHYSPEVAIGANSTSVFKIVSTSVGTTATGAWILGASTGGQYYGGDIAEVIVYDSALSGGDITDVTDYLEAKYAL